MSDTPHRAPAGTPDASLLVVIPIYNDWDAVSLLLLQLDHILEESGVAAAVLLVDDGSTSVETAQIAARAYFAIVRIDVLRLRRNIGHQRAIAIALAFAHEERQSEAVLVMDGDGEDAPNDVPRLLGRLHETQNKKVIFAARRRRSESLAFRFFYSLYRFAHLALTGIPVRVGNFSVIPAALMGQLVVVSELWNHYAAAVFKARLPHESIPTTRGRRLIGRSRMNFVALVAHGMSALSVHSELIGARLLVISAIAVVLVCVLIMTVVAVRLMTTLAIPGWATMTIGLLVLLLFQLIASVLFFSFMVLHGRSQPLFIPLRDYSFFVDGNRTVYEVPKEYASVGGSDAGAGR